MGQALTCVQRGQRQRREHVAPQRQPADPGRSFAEELGHLVQKVAGQVKRGEGGSPQERVGRKTVEQVVGQVEEAEMRQVPKATRRHLAEVIPAEVQPRHG